jgi:hypothetical protein
MVRKLVGIGIATVGGLALMGSVLGGDRIKIYGQTGERIIQERLDDACGVATKLEVLKTRVQELDKEVVHLRQGAVSRQVDLDLARARVAECEASVERQKKVLARAAELLDENRDTYEISGRHYARAVVEDDARAKLESCSACERSLEDERKVIAVRERTLELAKAHLDRATKRRVELAQLVRTLEARVAQQQAKRALADALDTPPFSAEVQGELAKAEQLAKEVEAKLEVEDRVLDERLAKKDVSSGTIDYDGHVKAEPEDMARAIRAHLAGLPAEAPKALPAPKAPAIELH